MSTRRQLSETCEKCGAKPGTPCLTSKGTKATVQHVRPTEPSKKMPAKKAAQVVRKIAKQVNLDPSDINSDLYVERPPIAEVELGLKVLELCKGGRFDDAAKAIETEVRLAHGLVEAS